MKNIKIKILLLFLISIVISCSSNKELIKREKTEFGLIKYYVETASKKGTSQNRIVVKVANSVYYSFYSDRIVKHTKLDKALIYTLFYGEIPEEMNSPDYYQRLSKLDSIVLSASDRILDSLKWKNYKRWNGATAFLVEVCYYHGFPKNEKFKPY